MALSAPDINSLEAYLSKPRGDKLLRLHISRNTLIAFVVSIVLHLLVLLFFVPKIDLNNSPPSSTIVVNLAPQTKAPQTTSPEPAIEPMQMPPPQPQVKPEPKIITKKPASKPSKPSAKDFSVPKVLTQDKNEQVLPTEPTKPQTPADAPTDMASYIAQQRAKREAAEQDAARQNTVAAAAEIGLTEEQKRDERIKNNLKSGTNGIFSIQRLEAKSASFSFKGWTDYTNVKLKFYQVEASSGEDVRLVMIRQMIAIIREHYDGDFPWESHRLGRTITKSARLEDSAELEDFLMQEFFGRNYKTQ
jgi:hypothetical protein